MIFIVTAVVAAAVILLAFYLNEKGPGAGVVVTVGGETYGTYSLMKEQEIPIVTDGVRTNLLRIADGKAMMEDADCPDKLCVHHRAISKANETIVCLPNKVVVTVTGGEESEFDSIAK